MNVCNFFQSRLLKIWPVATILLSTTGISYVSSPVKCPLQTVVLAWLWLPVALSRLSSLLLRWGLKQPSYSHKVPRNQLSAVIRHTNSSPIRLREHCYHTETDALADDDSSVWLPKPWFSWLYGNFLSKLGFLDTGEKQVFLGENLSFMISI